MRNSCRAGSEQESQENVRSSIYFIYTNAGNCAFMPKQFPRVDVPELYDIYTCLQDALCASLSHLIHLKNCVQLCSIKLMDSQEEKGGVIL